MTPGIGVLGEFVEGNSKKQKSKDPSSDEVVPPSSEMDLPKTRDRMQERSASPENVTAGAHLMSGSLGTWNQGNRFLSGFMMGTSCFFIFCVILI